MCAFTGPPAGQVMNSLLHFRASRAGCLQRFLTLTFRLLFFATSLLFSFTPSNRDFGGAARPARTAGGNLTPTWWLLV